MARDIAPTRPIRGCRLAVLGSVRLGLAVAPLGAACAGGAAAGDPLREAAVPPAARVPAELVVPAAGAGAVPVVADGAAPVRLACT